MSLGFKSDISNSKAFKSIDKIDISFQKSIRQTWFALGKDLKTEAEHEIKRIELEAKLSHPFALKMATLICYSVLSAVVLLGIFFGDKTPLAFGIVLAVAIVFGAISFRTTYGACL